MAGKRVRRDARGTTRLAFRGGEREGKKCDVCLLKNYKRRDYSVRKSFYQEKAGYLFAGVGGQAAACKWLNQ